MEKGFTIRHTPDPRQPLAIKIHGSLTFQASLDLCMFALQAFMRNTAQAMQSSFAEDKSISEEEKNRNIRAVLYDKAVLAFSYVADDFYPEGKELKADPAKFEEYLKQNRELTEPVPVETKKVIKEANYND